MKTKGINKISFSQRICIKAKSKTEQHSIKHNQSTNKSSFSKVIRI